MAPPSYLVDFDGVLDFHEQSLLFGYHVHENVLQIGGDLAATVLYRGRV